MEEVWKDITESCNLHNEIPTTPSLCLHHHLPRTDIVLQDFFAGSPFRDQVAPPSHHRLPQNPIDLNQMESASNLDPSPHLIGICPTKRLHDLDHHQQQHQRMMMTTTMNVDRFGVNFIISDEDRRQRRMIKNRESAARSRARKQAYTNELESAVAHLVQENAMLRRQCEELKSAMAAQNPAKKSLQRASSASF